LNQLQRKLGVKRTDDPDAVVATLLVAKRLVSEGFPVYESLAQACKMAAAKDDARVWWASHRAINSRLCEGMYNIFDLDRALSLGEVTSNEVLELIQSAVDAQLKMNAAAAQGKKPNMQRRVFA
jgi:hypothetical protein